VSSYPKGMLVWSPLPDSACPITREYHEPYMAARGRPAARRIGMTRREMALNGVFMSLYLLFAAGIVVRQWHIKNEKVRLAQNAQP